MRKKILLVEDEKIFCNLIIDILEEYDVFIALDGIYGLKIGKLQKPDLIIIDLNLPRMDGEEMLRKVREDEMLRAIPVVLISGTFTTVHTGERVPEYTAEAVFSKPLDIDRFREKVRSLVPPM
ncbi:MAG: response regulator [Fibrobacterota bacterium]